MAGFKLLDFPLLIMPGSVFFFVFAQLRLGTTQFQKSPSHYFNTILDERRLGGKACSAGKPSVSRTMGGLVHAWLLLIEGLR